jgi:hypothetical protein
VRSKSPAHALRKLDWQLPHNIFKEQPGHPVLHMPVQFPKGHCADEKKIKNKLNKIRNNKISVISLNYQTNQIGGQRYLNIIYYELLRKKIK